MPASPIAARVNGRLSVQVEPGSGVHAPDNMNGALAGCAECRRRGDCVAAPCLTRRSCSIRRRGCTRGPAADPFGIACRQRRADLVRARIDDSPPCQVATQHRSDGGDVHIQGVFGRPHCALSLLAQRQQQRVRPGSKRRLQDCQALLPQRVLVEDAHGGARCAGCRALQDGNLSGLLQGLPPLHGIGAAVRRQHQGCVAVHRSHTDSDGSG
mmetsp:Transcript_42311/g.134432  ORF Transcript_42311/g.134432 Transcript_42311/m.134432 type:complete len:212 (-) Transcript_42311:12-647(-)